MQGNLHVRFGVGAGGRPPAYTTHVCMVVPIRILDRVSHSFYRTLCREKRESALVFSTAEKPVRLTRHSFRRVPVVSEISFESWHRFWHRTVDKLSDSLENLRQFGIR
jgi:hypothetical protein